ncbi:MAG: hypothetical protein ACOCT9_00560, partial [archaeon]
DLTRTRYEKILQGEEELNGKTGGEALREALKNVDVDEEIEKAKEEYQSTNNMTKKNKLSRKLRFLNGLKKTNKKPKDFMMTKMPVLPPKFRPIYELPNGSLGISDVNELYKHTILVNKALRQDKELGLLDKKEMGEMREELYNSLKGVQGLGDPITRDARIRNRKGILKQIGGTGGTQPKDAFFQNKVIRKRQDLSGRSIIVAGPELDVDTIGLPKDMAWKIFKPHVLKKMIQERNIKATEAKKHYENRSEIAEKALKEVTSDTPVILNRAPSLHKFSTMAFKPRLVEGKSIRLPSLVTEGFNADFDGDTMAVHVPVSEEAKKEAFEKMLPSENLFRPGHNDFMYSPGHEQILGLYYLTKNPDKDAEIKGEFSSKKEALKAFEKSRHNGKNWSKEDPIKINGEKMTIGKIIVNNAIPKEYRKYDEALNKKYLTNMFKELGEKNKLDNKEIVEIANKLKDLGNEHVYKRGFSVSLSDLDIDKTKKEKIYNEAKQKVEKIKEKTDPKKDINAMKKINDIFNEAEEKVYKEIIEDNPDNAFVVMQKSGARGNEHNVRQILGGPGLLTDNEGKLVPVPVTHSYGEGIDTAEYWTSMYGARKGMIDRAKSTSEPGAFTKELINNTLDHLITEKDCGTNEGIVKPLNDKDTKHRFLAEKVKDENGKIVAHHNDLLDRKMIKDLKKHNVKQVKVRTPLKCEAENGLCSKCYGAFADGQEPEKGTNIGIIAGQALTEPTTQMTMDSFHSGGVAAHEQGKAQGMERLDQIFHMPETLRGKATIATTTGTVDKIEKTETGGKEVYINGKRHFVPPRRKLEVKEGDKVKKGDQISTGVIKPQELLEAKDLDSVREYITDELAETYRGDIHKPTIEAVVEKVTNLTKIEDPGDTDFVEGQYASLNKVKAINKKDELSIPVDEAAGKELAKGTNGISSGTKLTSNMIDTLKNQGVRKVKIKHKKIKHKPELKGINQLPYYKEDWMAKMNFGDVPRQFTRSAGFGSKSKYKDTTNPIPAFAHGASFGDSDKRY